MDRQIIQSVEQQQGINRFLAKSFMWMIVGLLISAFSAYYILKTPALLYAVYGTRFGVWILLIAQMVLAYTLRVNPEKLEKSVSYIVKFALYSVLTGFTFAVVALAYTATSIFQAFVTTAGLFGILTIYGYTTKRDLSKMGNMMGVALLAVILLTFINVFIFNSSGMQLVLTIATLVIFIGLTMYDIQKIRAFYLYFENQPQLHTSLSISCALELYLDFINLFLSILRLFGKNND